MAQSDNLASQTTAFAQLLDDFGANNSTSAHTNDHLVERTPVADADLHADLGLNPPAENVLPQTAKTGKDQPPHGSMLPPVSNPSLDVAQAQTAAAFRQQSQQADTLPTSPPRAPGELATAASVERKTADVVDRRAATVIEPATVNVSSVQRAVLQPQIPATATSDPLQGNLKQSALPPANAVNQPSKAVASESREPASAEIRALDPKAKSTTTEPIASLTKKTQQNLPEQQSSKSATSLPQPAQAPGKSPTDTMNPMVDKGVLQVMAASHQPHAMTSPAPQQHAKPIATEPQLAEQTGASTQTPKTQGDPVRAQLEMPQPRTAPTFNELEPNRGAYEPRRNLDAAVATAAVDPRGAVGVVRAVADMRQALNNVVARQSRPVAVPAADTSAPADAKLNVEWMERVVNAPSKTEHLHNTTARHTVGELNMTSQTSAPRSNADAVYDQVMRAVTRQALQQGKLNLQLTPRELGSVDIEFSTERGELQVAIVAREHATRDLLDQTLPRLRQSLQDAGINLGEVEVRQEQNRQQHAGTDQQRSKQQPNVSTSPVEQQTVESRRQDTDGRLNIYV